jgi:hypothetical protein
MPCGTTKQQTITEEVEKLRGTILTIEASLQGFFEPQPKDECCGASPRNAQALDNILDDLADSNSSAIRILSFLENKVYPKIK